MAKKAATVAAVSLAALVAATREHGSMFVDPAAVEAYVKDGLAETNSASMDGDKIAARATEKGMEQVDNEQNSGTAANTGAADTPTFEIESFDYVQPKHTRERNDKYPFDALTAPVKGDNGEPTKLSGFFIPATDAQPNPAKTLQSTVNGASRRYSRKVGDETFQKKNADGTTSDATRGKYEYDRKFRIRAGEKNGTKGAIVERIV